MKTKLKELINEHGFKFLFGKEAPRLSELKTLTTEELHDRTFSINIDACKQFASRFFGFFLALSSLLELGAHEYVLSVLISVVICMLHMNVKVFYTLYCELKHGKYI